MQDDRAKTESELTRFFAGLDAGLNRLREVRITYDEQIAFDFNMLQFFEPRETKISEILAFFLDRKKHGQKSAFLRTFLAHFELSDKIESLLKEDEQITVECEDSTETNRKIDVTVSFKNANFVIGIENKIYAKDQQNQVQDYCKDLHKRTQGNYVLLYLSVDGHEPSETSISKDELEALLSSKKIQIVSYSMITDLLKKYETVCRADNVRGFIRQFQQYIKQEYLGESFMGEDNFVEDCLREHPEILKHIDALGRAANSLKKECFDAFWAKLAEQLKTQSTTIYMERMQWRTSSYSHSDVEHLGSPFGNPGELSNPTVFYEPSCHNYPVYIAIGMGNKRNGLSPKLKDNVEILEAKLKDSFKELQRRNDWNWCAVVPLPHPHFNDGEAICEFLQDKDGSKMQDYAKDAADKISQYIEVAEKAWREMERP